MKAWEMKIVVHDEPEFATVHGLLGLLSHPDGPMPNRRARNFLGQGLAELIGVYEAVGHEPSEAARGRVTFAGLDDAREQLADGLAALLAGAPTLEDSLRLVRVRDWVNEAWAEYELVGPS